MNTLKPKRLREIRLGWSIEGRLNQVGEPIQGGVWQPDTPDNRHDVTTLAEAGNWAYGPGTHWVEEREA